MSENIDIVELLINEGADLTIQDEKGLTARSWAGRRNHGLIVELLKKAAEEKSK